MEPCFPGFSKSMSSVNSWCFAFVPVPYLPEALDMALEHSFTGLPCPACSYLPTLTMLLVFSSLYFHGFRVFPYAVHSQTLTSSPFEPQTLDSNDSWTSLFGWEAVGFTAQLSTQLLQPEAGTPSSTPPSLSHSAAIQQQVLQILPSKFLPHPPSHLPCLLPPHYSDFHRISPKSL